MTQAEFKDYLKARIRQSLQDARELSNEAHIEPFEVAGDPSLQTCMALEESAYVRLELTFRAWSCLREATRVTSILEALETRVE